LQLEAARPAGVVFPETEGIRAMTAFIAEAYFLLCCVGISGTHAGVPCSHLSLVIGR
jgi:hypothetical protein